MGNPLTQDGIKGLVKKLRKRGDELPNPEYNPDSVMLYQAAQALEAQDWRDIGSLITSELVLGFDGEELFTFYRGEGDDFFWSDSFINPPEDCHPTHWKPLTPPETE